ncbi:GH25 family lysozyme [Eisenbergiella sp.]
MKKIKGIDVSKWQGTIDWAKVAGDGVKFAMIRLGYGGNNGAACGVDNFYQKNVEGALANGIAVGCYFYSYALNVEGAKKEAAFAIQQLAKYKGRILYPIAFDIEDKTQAGLGKKTLTDMVTAFCSALEAAGYYASFYCNADWARNRLDMQALARFDFWLAQWTASPTYTGHAFNMWQSSSKGRVAGISGDVDMDTAFVDYETEIKKNKLNGYTGSVTTPRKQEGDNMNDRQKFVNTAASFIGCKEADGSHRQFIDIYNEHKPLARGYAVKYTDAWCATFVSAMAIKCGLTDIIPTECGCGQMIQLFQKLGEWQENDTHVPQPGDIIFYDWEDSGAGDNTGWPDHVGIVESVSGSTMKVIEGNMSDAVGRRTMQVNGRYIRGYGLPKFNGDAGSKPAENTDKKTVAQLADEVLAGIWGNGTDRKNRLTAAGYNYDAVQIAVNAKLSGQKAKKSNTEIAKEVIAGKWGNGTDRKKRLEAEGYNYAAVQQIVNKLI